MTEDQQKAYEALLDMFASDGWQYFQDEVSHILSSAKLDLEFLNESRDVFRRQGNVTTLQWVTNYEGAVRTAVDQLEEQEQEFDDADV